MNIIDLTKEYQKYILDDDFSPAYEKTYPALFKHYHRYWGSRKNSYTVLAKSDIKKRKKLIVDSLRIIVKRMKHMGFDLGDMDFVLFVGKGTSNGHAFKDAKKIVIWTAIECYKTKLQSLVFIAHEIFHGLHYSNSPDFNFKNTSEKQSVARQFITEGLATYLSMKIFRLSEGEALWADHISKKKLNKWFQKCLAKERELYSFILKNFSSSSPKIGLFYSEPSDNIYCNRGGYFAGLRIISQICNEMKLSSSDLIRMSRKNLEKLVIRQLQVNTQ